MTLIEFLRLPLEEKRKGIWLSGTMGEGEYVEYWGNGQLWECSNYKNGNRHGEYKWWYENGILWTHSHYKNGILHGEYKTWYKDGKLGEHFIYENGTIIKELLG